MVDPLTFGARVRAARERRNWTQRDLRDATGLSQAAVSRVEGGVKTATIPELLTIASALGTTLGDLTGASPVRDRLTYSARTGSDTAAEEMRERLAFYLEMDAHYETLGYTTR